MPEGPDGYVVAPGDPLASAHALIDRYLEGTKAKDDPWEDPKRSQVAQEILAAGAETRIAVVRAGLVRLRWLRERAGSHNQGDYHSVVWDKKKPDPELMARHLNWLRCHHLHALLGCVFERQLPCSWEDTQAILRTAAGEDEKPIFHEEAGPIPGFVPMLTKQIQKHTAGQPLDPQVREWLARLRTSLQDFHWWGGFKKSLASLDEILSSVEAGMPQGGEAWTDAILRDVGAMSGAEQAAWKALLKHAPVANKHEPSAKWLQEAERRVAAVESTLDARLAEWLGEVGRGSTAPAADVNADYLKGLFWYASLRSDEALCRAVAGAAEACLRKTPGGLYCSRAVKSALYALERMPGSEPMSQLVRLKLRVKSPWGLEQIEETLGRVMARLGMPAEELEELAVPDYGLQDGSLTQPFGDARAVLRITGSTQAELSWFDGSGKALKSAPAAVTKGHGEAVKALKRTVTDIEKMLGAQRARLERLFLARRSWTYPEWRKRYLDQPLLAGLVRRLLWQFRSGGETQAGIWHNGELRDREGRPLAPDEGTEVRLWHPLDVPADEVLAWRVWLEEQQVSQPFKQAHREVYLLTEAERDTGTFSNRFAAHILRQHQLAALCRERNWEYGFLGAWDSGDAGARLSLPEWDLEVEFYVDVAGDGTEQSEAGVLMYVSTDRVEFRRAEKPVRLEEIPALVFSEVMRDVDLFVGVSSIGNDSEWGAPTEERTRPFDDYWQSYSFGELSAAAVLRRDVLRRLLPRLKIADRCTLEERYLKVRGDLRTYKIHLRSGNILMEPNDQYLCIVPGKDENRGTLFLPFEGDQTLAVIVSKALMLADDRQITDPWIRKQIGA